MMALSHSRTSHGRSAVQVTPPFPGRSNFTAATDARGKRPCSRSERLEQGERSNLNFEVAPGTGISVFFALVFVSLTSQGYPGIAHPSQGGAKSLLNSSGQPQKLAIEPVLVGYKFPARRCEVGFNQLPCPSNNYRKSR
jgi:hypothetical protein